MFLLFIQSAILNSNNDAVAYVRALLAAGANCNTIDQFGHTPMMTLIRRRRRRDKEHVQDDDVVIGRLLLDYAYHVDLLSKSRHW